MRLNLRLAGRSLRKHFEKREKEATEALELKLKEQKIQSSPVRKMQSSLKKNELFSPTSDLITKPVLEAETKLKEKEAQLTLLISAVEREKQKLDLIRAEVAAEVKRGTEYEAAMLERKQSGMR